MLVFLFQWDILKNFLRKSFETLQVINPYAQPETSIHVHLLYTESQPGQK